MVMSQRRTPKRPSFLEIWNRVETARVEMKQEKKSENENIKVEKSITDTEKATREVEEAKIAPKKIKHSTEEAKDFEKALIKFKLEAEQARAICRKHNDEVK